MRRMQRDNYARWGVFKFKFSDAVPVAKLRHEA